MTLLDKTELLKQAIEKLETQRQLLIQAANEAKDYSTSEESKAENKYDTRGLEASYLASGQAQRAQQVQEQIYLLQKMKLKVTNGQSPIGVGDLILVMVNQKVQKRLFILPVGGLDLLQGQEKVQSITLNSPLGQAVHSKTMGYEFEINDNEYEILGVQ